MLADSTQSNCPPLYARHGHAFSAKIGDFSLYSASTIVSKEVEPSWQFNAPRKFTKTKMAPSGVRIAEKYPIYNIHKRKFHDVHLNLCINTILTYSDFNNFDVDLNVLWLA
ncbi:hypothetical protein AVEN_243423-1 [Araneus ventricosus]|uniref:Uncharacterized protein n=1 Tax=Araneus ventricosus TaxID=182803 RepID=A0A4Y2NX27_ARAVE|nr:hypothetical protein AVEN_243423-1 [Araneus ventricosus]